MIKILTQIYFRKIYQANGIGPSAGMDPFTKTVKD